ncbi:bifunctional DedA family/phosphatase PAP2 family protein [Bacillus sp. JJ675]|uniref:bifunctional DedA family/phosphatase PAP2 family protein n=1 Tax=Bacillus sp. JJ675 TaxID=3122972 RepID=UPI002FFF11C0
MQFLTGLIGKYGYAVLFFSLMAELLGLPLPGDFLLGYAGVLVYEDKLNWILSILLSGAGGCLGMTLSYWTGYKLGTPFLHKYGRRIHFGPEQLEKTSRWFETYGNKLLLFAYFIPGVRHITGYFSGITQIPFRTYMLFSYCGAFLWTGTFIFLGNILGPKWDQFHASIKKYLLIGGVIAVLILIALYFLRAYKAQMKKWIIKGIGKGALRFHSLRRLRLLIACIAILFLGFALFMTNLTEGYLNNELQQFDHVVMTLVPLLFNERWAYWMACFGFLASVYVLIPLIVLTLLWIVWKGKERRIEVFFLFFTAVGGEIYEEGIRRIFQHLHPVHPPLSKHVLYPFPSEQTLTAFVLFGFSAYLLVRHSKKAQLHTLAFLCFAIILVLIGLSRIYLRQQLPSDVIAGYAFGGVWLSLNVLVMELFRFSRRFGRLKRVR